MWSRIRWRTRQGIVVRVVTVVAVLYYVESASLAAPDEGTITFPRERDTGNSNVYTCVEGLFYHHHNGQTIEFQTLILLLLA